MCDLSGKWVAAPPKVKRVKKSHNTGKQRAMNVGIELAFYGSGPQAME